MDNGPHCAMLVPRCRRLLETTPARLLPALEARPLLQRTRRTRPSCTF